MDELARPLSKQETKTLAEAFTTLATMFTRVAERAKRIEDATKAVESKPKSPLSAFHLYYKDSYAGIIKDNPDLNYSQVLATARDRWRHADSATRLIYKDRAEEQKIRYAIEMAAYNDRAADRRNIYDIEVAAAQSACNRGSAVVRHDSRYLRSTESAEPLESHLLAEAAEKFRSPSLLGSSSWQSRTSKPSFPSGLSASSLSSSSLDSPASLQLAPIPWPIEAMSAGEALEESRAPVDLMVRPPVLGEYPSSSIQAIVSGLIAIAESTGTVAFTEPTARPMPTPSGLRTIAPSGLNAIAPSGLNAIAPSGLNAIAPSGLRAIAPKRTEPVEPGPSKPATTSKRKKQPDNAAAHDPGAEPTTVKKRGKRAANTASQNPNAEQTASPRKKKARRASTNAKEGESGKKRKPAAVAQVATPAMPSTLFG